MDVLALLPELCLLLGAVASLLVGLWLPRRQQWPAHAVAALAALAALVATAVAAAGPDRAVFSAGYQIDATLHVVRAVVAGAVPLVLAISRDQVRHHPRETEFATLVLLAALGAVLLAGANDLLVLAAAYLLATVPLYALAGFGKDAGGTEAALKLALFGALLGITMLAGITVLFGLGGASGYPALAEGLRAAPPPAVVGAVVATAAGLLFKAGAVPGHFWLPDAVEGTGIGVAAFLTTVPKVGAIAALYRLVTDAVPAAGGVALLLALLAVASMTLGNLAAFGQDDVRRLLGYSTVSQVGYLLIAPAAAGAELARPALLLYLVGYTVTNLGAFAVVAARPGAHQLSDYSGLFYRDPLLALTLVVCLLGFVGTPPTAVFAGKLTVFTAGLDAGLGWLVVLAAVNTVASVFYYLRWIAPLFREAGTREGGARARWARGTAYTAGAATLLVGVGAGVVLAAVAA
ncbi:NADH-quinone oxidoreductase subunit N [Amycolatopsis arida]|uniref:NADH-quinone oxidoreductase subunit N n=2 Tax=Amycolatopsis arida TaxID=587909 RepID=A0A1I6AUC4_9PSEU|nr:NADH-quinone oxidoreductase subunit N [Amycolatopsis arida]SFQ72077.1 NADH-quinone oxidoreductase subunit N [Amycolatopsis arida]